MRYLLLVVAVVISQVSFAQNGTKQITLDDIYRNNTFHMQSVPGFNAMKDGLRYTKLDSKKEKQTINVYDLKGGSWIQTIFNNEESKAEGEQIHVNSYTFSDDEQKLLLYTEREGIYRHSAKYIVYVYDIKTKSITKLDNQKVLHASLSPDGSKVAYVRGNDLYYNDMNTGDIVRVTIDGKWNHIINGNCDWVYEEEFGFTQAFQWSPDGKHIAYYRFDESGVPEYTIPIYNGLYPENYTYKYPKTGEPNSVVEIRIYDLDKKSSVTVNTGKETDQYIPRIKWTKDPNKLCVYRLNRLQNELDLLLADAVSGSTSVIYNETNKYYVDINDNLQFLPDGHSFIFTSERDGYNHLYNWDWNSKRLNELTPGKYDIDAIIGIDESRKKVYYTAAKKSPMERKLYSVNWNGWGERVLTPEDGTHDIVKVEGYNYFLDKYSALNEPPVYYLRNNKGERVRTLEDNIKLALTLQEYELGTLKFTTFKSEDGVDLNGWMITPPNFDESKKYPVLMYQYSGPGSQQVMDRFPVGYFIWHQMLAQKGYIIVCVDGRGTGMRGEEFKKQTYLQLGNLESNDQIAVAKQLSNLKYVDKDRIGIWGWSYGGFMSSTCLFKGNGVFKMAIAVAPVSNWRYYDNIYTERYMRTPQENPDGYDNNAPETMVKYMHDGTKFLLIHGTADDNVHFQNAVMLTEAMIQADKEFESEYYPDKHHGISGGNTRYHLFNRMTDFILTNL